MFKNHQQQGKFKEKEQRSRKKGREVGEGTKIPEMTSIVNVRKQLWFIRGGGRKNEQRESKGNIR